MVYWIYGSWLSPTCSSKHGIAFLYRRLEIWSFQYVLNNNKPIHHWNLPICICYHRQQKNCWLYSTFGSFSYINNETFLFYGWWQFSVCLSAFIALLSIWWHIGKKQNDLGQVWLALSVLAWSFSGAVEVYFVSYSMGNTPLLDESSRSSSSRGYAAQGIQDPFWGRILPQNEQL